MTVESTLAHGLKKSVPGSAYKTEYDENLTLLDKNRVSTGTLAARPSAGTAERLYYATDTGDLYYDDGANWLNVSAMVSHSHPESDIANLVADLSAKAAVSHSHAESDVTNLITDLSAKEASANKGVASGYASLDANGEVVQNLSLKKWIGNITDPLTHIPFRRANDELRLSGSQLFTRATTKYVRDPFTGNLISVAIDTPAFERMANGVIGVLLEGASTNDALHSADLTNSAWVKTGCTAAKDATGLDGVANSASTLTATAGNATCLQTVTAASAERTYSVDIKRKTGAGVVEVTIDGGTTWTAATLSSTVFTRFQITQTLVNPQFGIRLATSGDAVEVDANQCELLSFASSRIPTTTTAVTRARDYMRVLAAGNSLKYGAPRTIVLDFDFFGIASGFDTVMTGPTQLDQIIFWSAANRELRAQVSISANTYIDAAPGAAQAVNTVNRVGITFDGTTLKLWQNGVNTFSKTATGSGSVPDVTYIILMNSTIDRPTFGHVSNFRIYDRALTDAEMASA